jgi:hypothetical protein
VPGLVTAPVTGLVTLLASALPVLESDLSILELLLQAPLLAEGPGMEMSSVTLKSSCVNCSVDGTTWSCAVPVP